METEQFSLCWNNFHNNLSSGFHSLLQDEDLVDVTLAAEGQYLKAHKTILSVCSPYFKELFRANPCKHPIVILQDVNYEALKNLLQFMYHGEVSVSQEEIPVFMRVAEMLKVKGLTDNAASGSNGLPGNNTTENADAHSNMKRLRPPKKMLKPVHYQPSSDSPHSSYSPLPSESPRLKSPEPAPAPAKRACVEDNSDTAIPFINPKQEPVDDDYRDQTYEDSLDMSSMLDTSLTEAPHPSASWTPNQKPTTDTSSPGTLQCILGKRGNPRLIVDGHTFFKKSTYKGKSFWYCKHSRSPYKCVAVCWTLHGNIVKWPCEHNHPVIPEPFNPEEDTDVPIEKLQEVLIQTSYMS